MSTNYAKLIDALPNVANASDRDARFPVPDKYQKIFRIDTGNIEQWDGSSWVVVIDYVNGLFNVQSYGAQGDGVTNDTTALQDTINAAAPTFGTVWMPTGNYLHTGLTVPVGVSLLGQGMDATSLIYTLTSGNALTVTGVKHRMEGFSLSPQTVSSGHGLVATGFQFSVVARVRVRNFTNGIDLTDSYYTGFYNCAFDHNTQDGIHLGLDCNAMGFYDCTSTSNGGAGLYCLGSRGVVFNAGSLEGNAVGADVVANVGFNTATTTLQGVYFEGNTTTEVRVRSLDSGTTRPKGTVVRDCYFQPLTLNTVDAVTLQHHDGVSVESCTFDNLNSFAYQYSVTQSQSPTNPAFFKENTDHSTLGILTNAGAVTQKLPLVFDVRDYGAKGDGTTDDTVAIQAAADACKTANGKLFFPSGGYKTTASIDIDYTGATTWQPGMTICGVAPGFESTTAVGCSYLLPTNAVTGPALNITGVANSDNSFKGQVNGLTVQDLGIRGISGGTNGHGIYVKYFANLTIRNVWVKDCTDGVRLERQANGADYGYGLGVTMDRLFCVSNRGWGLKMADAGSITCTLLNPLFQSNTSGGVDASGAPLVILGGEFYGNGGPGLQHDEPTGSSAIFGPVCIGTRFESNNTGTLGPQVKLVSSTNPTFNGCWFLTSTNGEHGIELGEDATYFVRNCVVMNCLFNGKAAVVTQLAMKVGTNATNVVFQNNRTLNYTAVFGGTAGMGTDTQYSLGNEWYNRLNIILASVTRALGILQTGDTQPRMSINANGDISWGPGGATAVDTVLRRDAANRILVEAGDSFRINDSAYDGGKLILGANRIWIDTGGIMRYKGSEPTTTTDGTIVGFTQTTQSANDNSTKAATTAYVDRATTHTGTTSAAPTGTTSATAVMMGLAGSITPTRGTKIIVLASGQMANSTVNDGATVDLRFGTGGAPTNGTAVTGTLVGIAQTATSLVAAQREGFCVMGKVTGLSVGTAYWLDLSLLAVTGGTATVTGVSLTAFEVP